MDDVVRARIKASTVLGHDMALALQEQFPKASEQDIVECMRQNGYVLEPFPSTADIQTLNKRALQFVKIRGVLYRITKQPLTTEQRREQDARQFEDSGMAGRYRRFIRRRTGSTLDNPTAG